MTWPESDPDVPNPLSAAELLEREGWSADEFEDLDPADAVWARELLERETLTPAPPERVRVKWVAAAVAVALAGGVIAGVLALRPTYTNDADDGRHAVVPPAPSSTVTPTPPAPKLTGVPSAEWALASTATSPDATASPAGHTTHARATTPSPPRAKQAAAPVVRHRAPTATHRARHDTTAFPRPTSTNTVVAAPGPTMRPTAGHGNHGIGRHWHQKPHGHHGQ